MMPVFTDMSKSKVCFNIFSMKLSVVDNILVGNKKLKRFFFFRISRILCLLISKFSKILNFPYNHILFCFYSSYYYCFQHAIYLKLAKYRSRASTFSEVDIITNSKKSCDNNVINTDQISLFSLVRS